MTTKNSKPKKRGRRFANQQQYTKLAEMRKGDSIFFQDTLPSGLANIRRMCKTLGMKIVMRWSENDEHAGAAGTRVWATTPAPRSRVRHVTDNMLPEEDDEL